MNEEIKHETTINDLPNIKADSVTLSCNAGEVIKVHTETCPPQAGGAEKTISIKDSRKNFTNRTLERIKTYFMTNPNREVTASRIMKELKIDYYSIKLILVKLSEEKFVSVQGEKKNKYVFKVFKEVEKV
jgi:hypothetical protein